MEILLLCIIVILTILLFRKGNIQKEGAHLEQIDELQLNKELAARLHQQEIDGLKQIELELENERQIAYQEKIKLHQALIEEQENLKNYRASKITETQNEIQLYREEQLNLIKQEIIKLDLLEKEKQKNDFQILEKNYEEQREKIQNSITEIENELKDLYQKRQNTLNIIKEEEKLKNEVLFFKLEIKKEDLEDIKQLQAIERFLNNKDVLRKLIFKTYIETPMNTLFGRIGVKETPGIYKITNITNNLSYIGQSTNVKNRIKAHIQAAIGISTIANQLVHEKMSEDGLENFTFQLIETCDKEVLSNREKYWIDYYQSNTYGYNKNSGGARS